jgi:hypothetical protein
LIRDGFKLKLAVTFGALLRGRHQIATPPEFGGKETESPPKVFYGVTQAAPNDGFLQTLPSYEQ